MWAAVCRLPFRQRAVLALRFYEDLTESDIARNSRVPTRDGEVQPPPGSRDVEKRVVMTEMESIEERLRRTFRAVAELPVDAAAPVEPVVGLHAKATSRARGGTTVLRRVALVGAVGLIAAAAALVVEYGPRSSRPGNTEVPGTRPAPSSTPPTRGTLAQATIALNSYVAAEQSKEVMAANGSPANVWGAVISEHSAPEPVGNSIVAVTAYSFAPHGHPVQVLSYSDGQWALAQALPAPIEPGTLYHATRWTSSLRRRRSWSPR